MEKAQRHEDRRAVERVVTRCTRANQKTCSSNTCSRTQAACSLCAAPKQFDVIVTDNVRRHAVGYRRDAHRFARHAGLGPRSAKSTRDEEAQGAARAGCTAPRPTSPARGSPIVAMIASFAMALRYSFAMMKEARSRPRSRPRSPRPAHGRHRVSRRRRRHRPDGRCDHCRDGEAGRLISTADTDCSREAKTASAAENDACRSGPMRRRPNRSCRSADRHNR